MLFTPVFFFDSTTNSQATPEMVIATGKISPQRRKGHKENIGDD
jgi:hypothetical protein